MFLIISVMALAGMRTAVAQTYSGYLKVDDVNGNGPDSLYVTITVPEMSYRTRTIYIVDTVYVEKGSQKHRYGRGEHWSSRPDVPQYRNYQGAVTSTKEVSGRRKHKGYYTSPWMIGVKTNLLSDAVAIPSLGFEVQLYDNLSFDLGGWWSKWNIFHPNRQTRIYGAAPEVRWWFGEEMMRRGHFVGLHGMVAWYTLAWKGKDGTTAIYQNGLNDVMDVGSTSPSWSCGVTYGYSLPLDKTGKLGLEFYAGLGYQSYQYKRIIAAEDGSNSFTHHIRHQFGLTKVGANLTYRFSLRRYKER